MTLCRMVAVTWLSLCGVIVGPVRADAQATRAALVDSARSMIDNFNERQSITLLQRAVNPALGAPDALWGRGVQLLAQTLLQTNQRNEAVAWLRWALRLSPSLQVDSVNFTPTLVTAFQEARTFVASARNDQRAVVRHDWATGTSSGGFGDLRVDRTGGGTTASLQITANGEFIDEGRARRLAPGTYRILARSQGAPDADLTAEVLSSVTTVVTLNMVTAADEMAARRRLIASRLSRTNDAGAGTSSCNVAVSAGDGVFVSSYRAIRGAESIAMRTATGLVPSERVRVVHYDVRADLAVLTTGASGDSLSLAGEVRSGEQLWLARFPSCGDSVEVSSVDAAATSRDSIRLTRDVPNAERGGAILTGSGAVVGVLVGAQTARVIGAASPFVRTVRANLASRSVLSVSDVARREKHAMGEVQLRSSIAGARARVTPIEPWQWAEVARVDALPFTFRGPMGRYRVEVLDGDQVSSRTEIVVNPGSSQQIALGTVRKGRSKLLPIVGGIAAAGGIVALVAGKGGGGEKPPTTGTILVRLP